MSLTEWLHNEVPPPLRRSPVGLVNNQATDDLDALLTAVGADRDNEAFTVLFDHFVPRVQAQMVRLGLAPFAAADVTQDVMETIWRKAHLFDPSKAAASTWVFHIARNRRIDVKRRSRETICAVEDFFDIPDPADGCDDNIDCTRRQECLRQVLRDLPREQLALVKLAFFDGLSHSAIAKRMKLPLGTVKSRLRLAFCRLRRLLHDAGVTEA
ncbi:MAG TPA: sigma-70 family RNA polymerase sigma factor [Xanthobacteraceae bacterium]|nr:sigma-70 family RNA polymerase sigma factor [Xanthobacteraceae bacterium]